MLSRVSCPPDISTRTIVYLCLDLVHAIPQRSAFVALRFTDVHYGAIAKRAVLLPPSDLVVTDAAAAKFEAAFGRTWASALAQGGVVVNALGAAAKLGLNPAAAIDVARLQAAWASVPADKLVKFGGGFYLGEMVDLEGAPFYAVNVFYLNMVPEPPLLACPLIVKLYLVCRRVELVRC